MKKILYSGLLLGLIFISCKETVVQNPVQNGSLYIDSQPQGAKIYLQGTFNNQYTPSTIINLTPDSYDVKVEIESGVDSSFVMEVKSNLTSSATVDFENKMGKCSFQSNPSGAEIYLDGVKTNLQTPSFINYLKTGRHDYKLQLDNEVFEDSFYISYRQTIYVNYNFIPPVTETGSIFINSNPTGAQISVDGTNTSRVTPDTVFNLSTGIHTVSLSLNGYRDTSFTVTVVANQQTTKFIILVSTLSTTLFGPVRIYESANPNASDPSGLDLSTGSAISISTTDSINVDIYYSTNGYLVQSANLSNHMHRETFFRVGGASNLTDGIDSPTYPLNGPWNTSMGDRETNYVFLYDDDGNYSKLKITNFGGGSGTNPAWVELTWIYNNIGADPRF